jgi:hypothetical protein
MVAAGPRITDSATTWSGTMNQPQNWKSSDDNEGIRSHWLPPCPGDFDIGTPADLLGSLRKRELNRQALSRGGSASSPTKNAKNRLFDRRSRSRLQIKSLIGVFLTAD